MKKFIKEAEYTVVRELVGAAEKLIERAIALETEKNHKVLEVRLFRITQLINRYKSSKGRDY